jgi:hypothetical protein
VLSEIELSELKYAVESSLGFREVSRRLGKKSH